MASEIESLLEYVVNVGGSELIVTEGASAAVRFSGRVCSVPDAPVTEFGALREFLGSLEGDSGSIICGPFANCKWRVRYFREAMGNAAIFRPLMSECPEFTSFGFPQSVESLLALKSGLVVFAGPSCSGKTTSSTSFVSSLCNSRILRACFLDEFPEIPVNSGESLLLKDTQGTVSDKINQALLSGCDLIWMGDFSPENLFPMLKACEAGAIVVCTVTAGNSSGVLDSLVSSVESSSRDLARSLLAAALKAVIVQRLLPSASEGGGAVPAFEVLLNTQNVASLVRNGEFFKIPSILASCSADGMLLMDDSLVQLVKAGYVAEEEALKYVSNPARLG